MAIRMMGVGALVATLAMASVVGQLSIQQLQLAAVSEAIEHGR